MAVMIENSSLIIPISVIKAKYKGGWEQCLKDHTDSLGNTVWYDDYLFRDGVTYRYQIDTLLNKWIKMGFEPTERKGRWTVHKDICLVDRGFQIPPYRKLSTLIPCSWLEVGHKDDCCFVYLKGTDSDNIIEMPNPDRSIQPFQRRKLSPEIIELGKEAMKQWRATHKPDDSKQ